MWIIWPILGLIALLSPMDSLTWWDVLILFNGVLKWALIYFNYRSNDADYRNETKYGLEHRRRHGDHYWHWRLSRLAA